MKNMNNNQKVVLVDKNGKTLGLKDRLKVHKRPVPLHKAVSVLIFNGNKVLIQKRAKNKKTWPLHWSNTSCTHPQPEESYISAAKRRLTEEMGIDTKLKRKKRLIYKASIGKTWGENEYDWIFTGEYKGEVKVDPKEVVEYKWIDISKLKKDINKKPSKYTPWFIKIFESLC